MAEARLAVAFQFYVDHEGEFNVDMDYQAFKLVFKSVKTSCLKKYGVFLRAIHGGLFPTTPRLLAVLYLIFLLMYIFNTPKIEPENTFLSLLVPKVNNGFKGFIYLLVVPFVVWWFLAIIIQLSIRRMILFLILAMQTKQMTPKDEIKLSHKFAFLQKHRLYSYQRVLPLQSVPSLDETINTWLSSIRPLHNDEIYADMVAMSNEFKNGVGIKLQTLLLLKSWLVTNYITDWWEKYIYLASRSPIMINSNYYCLGKNERAKIKQAAKAANFISCFLDFKEKIENETLEPIIYNEVVPLCSSQYSRCFHTSRIPGLDKDVLVHENFSNSIIIVWHRGRFFVVKTSYHGKRLNNCDFEKQIQSILDDDSEATESELHLGALTAIRRDEWAKIRLEHFRTGLNHQSYDMINKSAFFVVLDDEELYLDGDENLTNAAHSLLHGKGYDRWFDKCITLVVFKNSQIGCNVEHSWADAPIMSHLLEEAFYYEVNKYNYKDDGSCRGSPTENLKCSPKRLCWDLKPLTREIEDALNEAKLLIQDVDMAVHSFSDYGKGFMKKHKSSPDAYIQIALQLAYYNDIGHFDLTYESSMLRLFREGRTETVRSCTELTSKFVLAFKNSQQYKRDELLDLFYQASKNHVKCYQKAMLGKGCDRHLFCLFVASKYLNVEVPFLSKLLFEPWKLSTSQTPLGQSKLVDFIRDPVESPSGGGFGPVADDGYGVSYIICGDDLITFHVSSKNCSKLTDSLRFVQNIRSALLQLRDFFEGKEN